MEEKIGDTLESESNRKKDAIEKLADFTNNISYGELLSIIFLIGLIISSSVIYFTRDYYVTLNNSDNEQIAAIVKQYKNLHKNSTSEYNRVLANYQRNGMLITPDNFYSTHKTTLEDCKTNHDFCADNNLIKNLNKNLAEYNSKLVNKIKKVNNAISNNIKINYDSLKIKDNINNNWLKSIVKQHVEGRKNQLKVISNIGKFILVFILVTGFLSSILL
jgi:hypothetical protein